MFIPYEGTDDNDEALFKIGMTLDFNKRLDEHRASFPQGVYHVAFLVELEVPVWENDRIEEWKVLIKKIETECNESNDVTTLSNSRKGATEWFYADVGLIHVAYANAEKLYG